MSRKSALGARIKTRLPSPLFRSRRIDPSRMPTGGPPIDPTATPRTAVPKDVDVDRWRFINVDDTAIEACRESLAVYEGSPGSVVLRDVWYLPQWPALYSADGHIIEDACSLDGPSGELWPRHLPRRIDPPATAPRITEPVVYVGGPLVQQFGHFLTESIARMWWAGDHDEAPLLCHDVNVRGRFRSRFVDTFYDACGVDRRRFVSFTAPVALDEVLVPGPTFVLMNDGFVDHRRLPEQVAERLLSPDLRTTSQPLYLSRTRLDPKLRSVEGEEGLVEILRDAGFAIAHPERLGLAEQIDLVNRHEVVVAARGSALHNVLFDLSATPSTVQFGYPSSITLNYAIIDAIKGAEAAHIGALERTPGPRVGHRRDRLHLDVALDGLRDLGLLAN